MTVQELREALEGLDPNAEVLIGTVPDQCSVMLVGVEGLHPYHHSSDGPRVVIGDYDYFAGNPK